MPIYSDSRDMNDEDPIPLAIRIYLVEACDADGNPVDDDGHFGVEDDGGDFDDTEQLLRVDAEHEIETRMDHYRERFPGVEIEIVR